MDYYYNNDKTTLDAQNQHIIQIVKDLQPQIHHIAFLIRVVKWQENPNYTVLLLCLCIIFQHMYKPILLLFPIIIPSMFNYVTNNNTQTKCHNESFLIEDLTYIHNNIQIISKTKIWIQNNSILCRAYNLYSFGSIKTRTVILLIASILFSIVYACWVILLKHLELSHALWSLVLLTSFVHSPWFSLVAHTCFHIVNPFIDYGLQKWPSIQPAAQQVENNRVYCFEIYHHQRWWFPAGWGNLLLPQDPSVWSDIHHEPTPSIFNFSLPPAAFVGEPDTNNCQKHVTWVWMDPEWNTVKDDTTDEDGWQYGNWQWKNWISRSGKLGICTRRQKWYRYAQRIERTVDVSRLEEEEEQSECNTTCTLEHSLDKWENSSSIVSSNSTDTTKHYHHLNSVVSFDNKGEKMLRRRSSNLSSSNIEFNVYLADKMYQHYCKTPTPKRLKRFSI